MHVTLGVAGPANTHPRPLRPTVSGCRAGEHGDGKPQLWARVLARVLTALSDLGHLC